MNLEKLKKELNKYPDYRSNQAEKQLFSNLITDWSQASSLPKKMRSELLKKIPLSVEAELFKSKDGTQKALISLVDDKKIETVLMKHNHRNTVCVSTQVGCKLGCEFCMTGEMGFYRNLKYWEIIEQVLYFARKLKKDNQTVNNIVFMGMGEPFLNYDNTWKAIEILNNQNGFNIGARNLSLSTAGLPEGIRKLAKENIQVNLAVSLHSADNEKRSSIMPINKKYPLEKLFSAIDYYIEKTNRQVMFEYLLLNEVNDSKNDARKLVNLLKKRLHFVNLIKYNQTGKFKPSFKKRVEIFKGILDHEGINYGQRYSFGEDIKGACGQLKTENSDAN
jgi:23S rRNA (adenine2503-C2)-methyltransferase